MQNNQFSRHFLLEFLLLEFLKQSISQLWLETNRSVLPISLSEYISLPVSYWGPEKVNQEQVFATIGCLTSHMPDACIWVPGCLLSLTAVIHMLAGSKWRPAWETGLSSQLHLVQPWLLWAFSKWARKCMFPCLSVFLFLCLLNKFIWYQKLR